MKLWISVLALLPMVATAQLQTVGDFKRAYQTHRFDEAFSRVDELSLVSRIQGAAAGLFNGYMLGLIVGGVSRELASEKAVALYDCLHSLPGAQQIRLTLLGTPDHVDGERLESWLLNDYVADYDSVECRAWQATARAPTPVINKDLPVITDFNFRPLEDDADRTSP